MSATRLAEQWPAALRTYRPLGLLGAGAAGVVWHAEQIETGRLVALKLLRARDAWERDAFVREAYALSKLAHRGVVAVLDRGVADDSPWYAMDLVTGTRFDAYLARRPPRALSLRCLRALCVPLRYVHGEGLVHRDLKPSNVFVREDGSMVLIDFGVASRFSPRGAGESLSAATAFAGSLAYASPEQLRGAFVDARADLYSLGCLLYEILTGTPPFNGRLQDIVAGHLQRMPVRPTELTAGVSPALEELTLGLLAKQARDRVGYAEDVVDVIDTVLEDTTDEKVLGRPYFYRPNFAGRVSALARLRETLSKAERGTGALVFVCGESGIGKTRLVMELTRYVRPDTVVVTAQCAATDRAEERHGQAPPMDLWRPLLRAMADITQKEGAQAVGHVFGSRVAALAQIEPALAGLTTTPLAPASGSQARERVLEAFAQSVEAFAENHLVLVILDDVQWADELSFAALERLSRGSFSVRRMLIVSAYRSEETTHELDALGRAMERIELTPVDRDAVASILADALALREPPPPLLSFVASASEGNPFFISEYLYEAADAGVLTRARGGRWLVNGAGELATYDSVGVPLTIRSLVKRRLARLSPEALRFAQAAAVLGRQFEAPVAADVAGIPKSEVAIHELVRRKVLETADVGLRFCHDKLREVVYVDIDHERARALHLTTAEVVERWCRTKWEPSEHYAQLAYHYECAGRVPQAARYHGLAGEHAFARGAFPTAQQFLRQSLALGDSADKSGRIVRARRHRMLGNAAFALGDLQSSIEQTATALDCCGLRLPTTTVGWCWFAVRSALRLLGDSGGAHSQDHERLREQSIAATQLAASFYYDARLIASVAAVMCGVVTARRCQDTSRLADAYSRLGYVLGAARLRGLAERSFELAHSAGGEDDDPGALALSSLMDAMYRLGVAEWARAIELGGRSIALNERSGNVQEAEVARTIVAHAYYYSGRVHDARCEYQSILESARIRNNRQHTGWGLFLSGRSALASGNVSEAIDLLASGYSQLSELPDIVSLAMCEGLLARAASEAGRWAFASEIAGRLLARLRSGRRPLVGQCLDAYGELAHVMVTLHARANTKDSNRAAQQAVTELARFAVCFPIATPALLRCRAQLALLNGDARRARRLLRDAATRASGMGMAVEREEVEKVLRRLQRPPVAIVPPNAS